MEINGILFSPTGTGRRVLERIARGLAVEATDTVRTLDLTTAPNEPASPVVLDGLAVFVAPVYGGRVAEMAVERLGRVRAAREGRTPAVVAVVYGNRDYEDALLELRDIAVRQGFAPLSGGAFVGEHSYSRPDEGMPIAQGRPDAADCAVAERFGAESRTKYEEGKESGWAELSLPGTRPYKTKGASTPATPTTDPERCVGCGRCATVCPTGVVGPDENGIARSRPERCIKCCACLKYCPTAARRFDTPYTARLFQHFSARREPELFL